MRVMATGSDLMHNPPSHPRGVISANEERGDEALGRSCGDPISLPLPLPWLRAAEPREKPLHGITSSAAQLRRGMKEKEETQREQDRL